MIVTIMIDSSGPTADANIGLGFLNSSIGVAADGFLATILGIGLGNPSTMTLQHAIAERSGG
jgi:hypothetical protein